MGVTAAKITSLPSEACALVREVEVALPTEFVLASGDRLSTSTLKARLHGPEAGPLIVAAGGISAGRAVADTETAEGWWSWAVRDAGPIDTRRVRVLAVDWLPTADQADVVTITTHDQARLLALVLEALGEARIDAFVGASYGGCVGLAFAELFPDLIGQLTVISAAHRAHPAATAWRGIQRRLLALGRTHGFEQDAIALSRQLAMATYRSREEFDLRFGGAPSPERAGQTFGICDYLVARGDAYRDATSTARWISLSDSLDRHTVEPEALSVSATVIGFTSDQLVPVEDSRALAQRLARLERLIEAPSLFGHDAFLKERSFVSDALRSALSPLTASLKDLAA